MSLNVLIMGRFMSGQSTFLAALTGRDIMVASTAQICVISTVEFGNDSDHVKVYHIDSDTPKIIPHDKFLKEFSPSQQEGQDVLYDKEGGRLDRFANVSHAEMQTNNPLFPGGLRLIISPGLEEDISRTRLTNEYVPKANAIIFMLNAMALFSANEKEYIEENFAGKHQQNVFFVVNQINQLSEPLEKNVIPCVRNGLSAVFTDENGRFDEDLFQKRVFYVNSYGALCARTGEPYKVWSGRGEMEIPIKIEETGFPEFESALWQYLRWIWSQLNL